MENTKIYAKFDKMIDPKKLKDNPRNRNKHGQDQIERLAKLYEFHGIRHPIVISNLSGCIVAGHGRKLAAIRAGLKEVPVVYQDFEDADAEYAFIQSDNAIASWAELDLSGVNLDLQELGPNFDLDWLGIKNFTLDPSDINNSSKELSVDEFTDFEHKCPKCGFEWDGSTGNLDPGSEDA